jgi:hypothetical protein
MAERVFRKRHTKKQGRHGGHPRSPREAIRRINRHLDISEERAKSRLELVAHVYMRDMVEKAAARAPISTPETATYWPGYLRASRYIYGPYRRRNGFRIHIGFDAPYAKLVHTPDGTNYARGEDEFLLKQMREYIQSHYFWSLLRASGD